MKTTPPSGSRGASAELFVPCLRAWPYRFELLDGLRGAAALAVVMHHVTIVPAGHFAVMVFFVISGYCITASAESCRERGATLGEFMARRIRRIYPPYLIAILVFTATRVAKVLAGGHDDLSRSAVEWLQNLTLTQWLSLLAHPQHWAADNPTLFVAAFWSLNYEEQFYMVIALCLLLAAGRRIPMIIPIMVLTVLGLALNLYRPGGWVCGIFLEYWAHFALGSLLFLVLCKYRSWAARAIFVAALVGVELWLTWRLLPWNPDFPETQRAFVELAVLIVFTLALLVLRPVSSSLSRSLLWRPFAALGAISYSLYLIHQFNLNLVYSAARLLLPGNTRPAVFATVVVALHIGLASIFWYCCERPFTRPRPGGHTPLVAAAVGPA